MGPLHTYLSVDELCKGADELWRRVETVDALLVDELADGVPECGFEALRIVSILYALACMSAVYLFTF